MGQNSAIEWTTHTFNGVRGCVKVSPGCAHCYAEAGSKRNPKVLGIWGANGTRVVAADSYWHQAIKWDKAARLAGERHRVFAYSLADVFEAWDGECTAHDGSAHYTANVDCNTTVSASMFPEGQSWDSWHRTKLEDVRERLFYFIGKTPNLDWLLLTKRLENWRRCWPQVPVPGHVQQNEGDGKTWENFPNVWMGTSVENREHGIPRIEHLRGIPARVRFLSVEPLLEDLGDLDLTGIHWVIVGGESGHNARSMDLRWVRKIRDQCFAQGVAFFCKQWGAKPYDSFYLNDQRIYLKDSHGGVMNEWTDKALCVRQFPII